MISKTESKRRGAVDEGDQERPTVIDAQSARGGVIQRGRVLTVLIVSMTLALIAMVVLLGYYYYFYSQP